MGIPIDLAGSSFISLQGVAPHSWTSSNAVDLVEFWPLGRQDTQRTTKKEKRRTKMLRIKGSRIKKQEGPRVLCVILAPNKRRARVAVGWFIHWAGFSVGTVVMLCRFVWVRIVKICGTWPTIHVTELRSYKAEKLQSWEVTKVQKPQSSEVAELVCSWRNF